MPSVQGQAQVPARFPQHIRVCVAVHQQNIPQSQYPAPEQLRRLIVQRDHITVIQKPQRRRYRYSQRRGVLRIVQVKILRIRRLFVVAPRDGHPAGIHLQALSHLLPEALQLAPAACQKDRGGRAAVQLRDLLPDGLRKTRHGFVYRSLQFLTAYAVHLAQNIRVLHRLFLAQLPFQRLRGLEVHQIRPHDRLRHLVPGNRRHGVARHASVTADRDIRCTRADVHQGQIQKPKLRRNRRVHGCNRLQGQTRHLQARRAHGRIQAFHHLAGQKRSHHIRLRPLPRMRQKGPQRVLIQPVLRHCVPHHKELPPGLVLHLQGILRRGQRPRFQTADGLRPDRLLIRYIHAVRPALGPQRPSSRSNTHPRQPHAHSLLQPVRHCPGQCRHLLNIINLPIQHGPAPVLRHLYRQRLEPASGRLPCYADNAPRADIQGVYQILFLRSVFRHFADAPSLPSSLLKTSKRCQKAESASWQRPAQGRAVGFS